MRNAYALLCLLTICTIVLIDFFVRDKYKIE